MTNAVLRYPFTVLFLLGAAVFIASSIQLEKDSIKQFLTCVVGAVLCAAFQSAYERFFENRKARFLLMGVGCLLTLGYYLVLKPAPKLSMEIGIRTGVVVFALFFSFIWLPVIQSRIRFNESFMAAFKAFFHSVFYSVVLYGGCCLVILAIDELLIPVSSKAYPHTANFIFVLFAPLFFLSRIPVYPGDKNKRKYKVIEQAVNCPKFLEILISYIIIPITSVFTGILLLYIVRDIRGEFWTKHLMEPMLVTYAISVILIYILSSNLENKAAQLYRMIIPKILIPIVMVQIAATTINLKQMGVTHSRYFVLSFGLFAVCAGIVMSFFSVRKNGIIAGLLILFSLESIIPPLDAFTVSRYSQENRLKTILIQNEMLKDHTIIPDSSISDMDKRRIASSVKYLRAMGYTENITWLPQDFLVSKDFYETFGFYDDNVPEITNRLLHLMKDPKEPIPIEGYDVLAHTFINSQESRMSLIGNFEKNQKTYHLEKKKTGETYDIILLNDQKQEIIRFQTNEILTRYSRNSLDKSEISNEEATFYNENEQAKLTLVVQEVTISPSEQTYDHGDFTILIRIK